MSRLRFETTSELMFYSGPFPTSINVVEHPFQLAVLPSQQVSTSRMRSPRLRRLDPVEPSPHADLRQIITLKTALPEVESSVTGDTARRRFKTEAVLALYPIFNE
ncbi:hypothetical protein NMY22_g18782 [Coprinellus aureogranulatus]|nr:hypothetical protein NMY22_g18782 [Coprinellus aureogranulatus]